MRRLPASRSRQPRREFTRAAIGRTLVVTMTNDQDANQIKVYDAESHALLQTLSTHGKGGVGGNARGIKQYDGRLVAVVNNGSGNVALFRRDGDVLKFDKVIRRPARRSAWISATIIMYVAGATTVDSFVLHESSVEWLDGTTGLALAGGGIPPAGSTAQVGVIDEKQLLVTLKTDPDPGTVDIVSLHRGRVTGSAPTAVSAPMERWRRSGSPLTLTVPRSSRWRTRTRTVCSATARLRRSWRPVRRLHAG